MQKSFKLIALLMLILSAAGINIYAQSSDTVSLKNSVLIIKSIPSQSVVYLDSEYVGFTPLTLFNIRGPQHQIIILGTGFLDYRSEVFLHPNDSLIINAILEPYYGSVSVSADDNKPMIRIDGLRYTEEQMHSLSLIYGAHVITIYDPSNKKELSSSFNIDSPRHMSIKYEHNVVSIPRLILSTILPGYSQIDDGNYLEGIGFALAGIASVIYESSENANYATAEKEYKSAIDDYDRASTGLTVEQTRNIASRKLHTYQVFENRLNISIGAVVLVWTGNALDLILNHLFTDRIIINIDTNPIYSMKLHSDYNITLAIGI